MLKHSALIAQTVEKHDITIDVSSGVTFRGICQGVPGSGKSELLSTIIAGICPCEYRQVIVFDDKAISFLEYQNRIHIFSDQIRYNDILYSLVGVMKQRNEMLKNMANKSPDIPKKTLTPDDGFYQIDIFIDEANTFFQPEHNAVTDKMKKDRMKLVTTLAQQGRSVGISMIIAGQNMSSKDIDTSLRNLLVDIKLGLRSGSAEATKFLTGDRYEEAQMELIPEGAPGLMFAKTNDASTGDHFYSCRAIRTPHEEAVDIAWAYASYKKPLSFLDASSDDYTF